MLLVSNITGFKIFFNQLRILRAKNTLFFSDLFIIHVTLINIFKQNIPVFKSKLNFSISNFKNVSWNYQWFYNQGILAAKNDAIKEIKLLEQIPGEIQLYKSIDTVLNTSEAVQNPIEFLKPLELPSFPPHSLQLEVETIIILLRNLNPPKLCNRINLVLKQFLSHAQ